MLTQFLTNIANAIRAKTGKTDPINAQDFAAEIAAIPTGSGGTARADLSASPTWVCPTTNTATMEKE